MIIEIPEMQGEIKGILDNIVLDICNKYNLNIMFVQDSKLIEECVEALSQKLTTIKENVKGELPKEALEDYEIIRKARVKEIKNLLNTPYYKSHPNCKKSKALRKELKIYEEETES